MPEALTTFEQVAALMSRLTYKPNFEINTAPAKDTDPYIATIGVTMYVPDSTRRHPPVEHEYQTRTFWERDRVLLESMQHHQQLELIPVRGKRFVPPYLNEDTFLAWLRNVLLDLERHELDEWFKLDGVPINNPHEQTISKRRDLPELSGKPGLDRK